MSTDFIEIWPNLDGSVSRERRSSVRLIGLDFSCKDPPTTTLINT